MARSPENTLIDTILREHPYAPITTDIAPLVERALGTPVSIERLYGRDKLWRTQQARLGRTAPKRRRHGAADAAEEEPTADGPRPEPAPEPRTASTISREERAVRREREAREDMRALRKMTAAREELIAAFREEYRGTPELVLPPRREMAGRDPAVATLQLADLHGGQLMELERGGHLGRYNLDVFVERVDRLCDEVLADTAMLRTRLDLHTLVIAAGGDLGDGAGIYPNHPREAVGLARQLRVIPDVLAARLLRPLAAHYPRIIVFLAPGNHGIVGGRKAALDYVADNLDVAIMDGVQLRCADLGHVEWTPTETWFATWEMWGHRFLLSHGDSFKAWLGIPFYGSQRFLSRLQSMMGLTIDCLLTNHHHASASFGSGMSRISMNGSMPGTGNLGTWLGLAGLPSQNLIITTPTHAVYRSYELPLASRAEVVTVKPFRVIA